MVILNSTNHEKIANFVWKIAKFATKSHILPLKSTLKNSEISL